MKKVFIIGSGGFSKQVIEIVEKLNKNENKYELMGLIDDNESLVGSNVMGYEILGNTDYLREYSEQNQVFGVIAIANWKFRKLLKTKLTAVKWLNLVHPSAVVSDYIQMGEGNVICAGVVINPDCRIGSHCHINIGTTMGHDIDMRNFVTVMPGSRISGNVTLMDCSMIGTGSTILQGLTIEENVIVGAGAVVTKNTSPNGLYLGVPANKKRYK